MKKIESILREERQTREKIMREIEQREVDVPKGHIRIMEKESGVQFYYVDRSSKEANGKYIKKSEINLARSIAQRDYDAKIVKNAEKRIKAIDVFLTSYAETDMKDIYEKMNPYRRELLTQPILSDEAYVRQWQSVSYEGKAFANTAQEIITEKGERVRSKSEKILRFLKCHNERKCIWSILD